MKKVEDFLTAGKNLVGRGINGAWHAGYWAFDRVRQSKYLYWGMLALCAESWGFTLHSVAEHHEDAAKSVHANNAPTLDTHPWYPAALIWGEHTYPISYSNNSETNVQIELWPGQRFLVDSWGERTLKSNTTIAPVVAPPSITICGDMTPETSLRAQEAYVTWVSGLSPGLQISLANTSISVGETYNAACFIDKITDDNLPDGGYNPYFNRIYLSLSSYEGNDTIAKYSFVSENTPEWYHLSQEDREFCEVHEIGHAICYQSGIFSDDDPNCPLAQHFNEDLAKLKPSQLSFVDEYFLTPCETGAQIIGTLLCPKDRPEGVMQLLFPSTTQFLIETLKNITSTPDVQPLHIYHEEDFPDLKAPDPNASCYYGNLKIRPHAMLIAPIEKYGELYGNNKTIAVGRYSMVGEASVFVGPVFIAPYNQVSPGVTFLGNTTRNGIHTGMNDVFVPSQGFDPVGSCIKVASKDLAPNRVYICKLDETGTRTEFWLPVKPFDQSRAVTMALQKLYPNEGPAEQNSSKRPNTTRYAITALEA